MIQDIAPHEFNIAYDAKRDPQPGDKLLCYRRGEVYLKAKPTAASGWDFPELQESHNQKSSSIDCLTYLFSIDQTAYYLTDSDKLFEDGDFQPVQSFRSMKEGDTVPFVMMTGLHISEWMRKNQFCGCCGQKTEPHPQERALLCPACNNLIFPQISPSVAVAVTNGDKILLARSAQGNFRRFALIAGYVEIGETIEDTVKREVLEEVGLKVKNIQYFKSQPWGLTGIQMLGFFAELSGSDEIKIQASEIAEARWFTVDEIDRDMPLHSLSYTLIDEFCKNRSVSQR